MPHHTSIEEDIIYHQTKGSVNFDIEKTSQELNCIRAKLSAVMIALGLSVEKKNLSDTALEIIQNTQIRFYDIENDPLGLLAQDIDIIRIVCEATLQELFENTIDFYGTLDYNAWAIKEKDYRVSFVKIGREVNLLFNTLERLKEELKKLVDLFVFLFESQSESTIAEYLNFNTFLTEIDSNSTMDKKKAIYLKAIEEREIAFLKSGEHLNDDEKEQHASFIDKCKHAIEILNYQIENQPNKSTTTERSVLESEVDEKSKSIKDFTTRRQVLAMYYLLNELDKSTHQIDRTVKARFIEFLTGKNYDSIYKALTNLLKECDSNKTQNAKNDIDYVKSHFENLGLKAIVQQIDNDMKDPR